MSEYQKLFLIVVTGAVLVGLAVLQGCSVIAAAIAKRIERPQ